jgi:hypothetical protein
MTTLQIQLAVDDWKQQGKSIYLTKQGVELSLGVFHHGTTFNAMIRNYSKR